MIVVLFACVQPPAVEGAGSPSPWSYTPEARDGTQLDAAALSEGLDDVVATIVATNPRTVEDAFGEALGHMGETCPVREANVSMTRVLGDCTTPDGWTWLGGGLLSRITDMRIELGDIDHWHRIWDFSNGNVQVLGPNGERYGLFGTSFYRDWDDDQGQRVLTIELWGEFVMEGVRYADTWLGDDRSVELYVEMIEGDGGYSSTWTGGMSRLDGPVWAFSTDALALSSTVGACAVEPVGRIDLQDQDGTWYRVTFDGDTTCDGCGAATVDGAPIGDVCADFSPLSAWETDPWSG